MKTDKFILPKVPSQLLRIALADEDWAHKSPLYTINMNTWHSPAGATFGKGRNACAVCLAGAVMANHLGIPVDVEIYGPNARRAQNGGISMRGNVPQLQALDWLRMGYVKAAFQQLKIPMPKTLSGYIKVTSYEKSNGDDIRRAWRADMFKMVRWFERLGH